VPIGWEGIVSTFGDVTEVVGFNTEKREVKKDGKYYEKA
jgi:alkylated DNA nucleotide flippase Atl1